MNTLEPVFLCLFGCWILQGVFGVLNMWAFLIKMRKQDKALSNRSRENCRPVLLIIPVKGANKHFSAFVDMMISQDYPNYRIIFACDSEDDPAVSVIWRSCKHLSSTWKSRAEQLGYGPLGMELCIAGKAKGCGQKVHNQLAALEKRNDDEGIVAFADADIQCGRNWLSRLVAPLNLESHSVSTTYRWLIPEQGNLANHFASAINGSVATLGGPEWSNLIWGGSMAYTREAIEEMGLPDILRGSLNDDLQLAYHARRSKQRIAYVRSLLVPTFINFTWSSLFEFAQRQYVQVKVYAFPFWTIAFLASSLYLTAFICALWLVFCGEWTVFAFLFMMVLLNIVRGMLRGKLCDLLFEDDLLMKLRQSRLIDCLGTSLTFLIHWLVIVGSAFKRTIVWAGITYKVKGRQKLEIRSTH